MGGKRWYKVVESSSGIAWGCEWWLASTSFVLKWSSPLLLLDGWERFQAALWQLLSAYLQCQTKRLPPPRLLSAATGWQPSDAGSHAGPHWLEQVPEWMPHVVSTWFKVQKHSRQTCCLICVHRYIHTHAHAHTLCPCFLIHPCSQSHTTMI